MTSTGLIPKFEVYGQKYEHVRMTRRDGILELRLHSAGGSLKWSPRAHEELQYCFSDIAGDPDNRVVIITGEGDLFCTEIDVPAFSRASLAWGPIHQEGRRMLRNLLDIEVPVIGAVNGPAHIHAELLLLSNIVLATPDATFQDDAHFVRGSVPGDGVHVVWPALLGPTRASYFLLTGQVIDAKQASALGFVNEVIPRAQLVSRAWAIAKEIAGKPPLVARYTRSLLTQEMKRIMHDHLSHGLALQGVAFLENRSS